ncbi:MAG TPA: cytochrome c oxidase subunit 3, partial [Blastocatellia bacterium]|nr:cytochrome c oxidase subunit 3 [Blastocatellia bacterium]
IETAMFTIFVVAYVFYIGKSLIGPHPSDVLDTPILSTICLLGSSLTNVMAERAFKRENVGGFRLWWTTTILLAGIFIGSTAAEWKRLIVDHHLTISTNLFGTTFYSLVGLHASHVIIGLTLLTLVLVFSLKNKIRRADGERIKMISWYWHFVDAVWVVVFTVVYVVGR